LEIQLKKVVEVSTKISILSIQKEIPSKMKMVPWWTSLFQVLSCQRGLEEYEPGEFPAGVGDYNVGQGCSRIDPEG